MASNNLTVDQIAAPDFSGIAQLMTGAGTSFNNAFDAANDILGKYQTGQQAKADAGYLNALGNIKNEAELTDFFAKNPLAKANLSPEMMKTMLGMRAQVLGYETSRAATDSTRATTSINLAGEKRNLYDWQDKIAALNAGRAAQPAITGAYIAGQQYGQASGGNSPSIPNTAEAGNIVAGLVARGVPEHVAQGVILNAQDESGLNPGAIGDNGNAGGLLQWNGARFKGLQAFARDQGKPWQDTEVQLDYFMHENKNGEKANWDKVVASGSSGEAAVNFVNLWERPAEEHRARRAAAYAGVTGGATPGPNGFTGGAQNGYLASPEIQAGLQAIQSNKYLTAAEAQAQVDALIGGAAAGQKTISDRDAASQALLASQAQLNAALDPSLVTQSGIQRDVATNPTLNPTTALSAAVNAGTLVGPGGGLNALALPGTLPNNAAQTAADLGNATDAASSVLTDIGRARVLADSMVSDPVKELMKSVGITEDNSDLDSRIIGRDLNRLAKNAGVSDPEMAATLKVFDDQGVDLEDVLTGVVDEKLVIDAAKAAYGAGQKQSQNIDAVSGAQRATQREAAILEINSLQTSMAKMAPGDPGRVAAQQRIQALTQNLTAAQTPVEKIAAKLPLVAPGSADFKAIAADLIAEMQKPRSGYTPAQVIQYKSKLGVP